MFPRARASRMIPCFVALLVVTACGKSGQDSGNTVAMKDLEVVDGTATDAMTDLDGVRSQGTAVVAAMTNNATVAKTGNATAATNDADAEAVPDQ